MASIVELLQDIKKESKRKFTQTWDLSVNLKNIDLNRQENKLNTEFSLPEGSGKQRVVGMFVDMLAAEAKKAGVDTIIKKDELASLAKNKKKAKQLANTHDFFFGEVTLMPDIAKTLGTVLGPRGKMPKPIPPKADISALLASTTRTVRVVLKDNPVIHVPVGTEAMDDDKVAANITAILGFIADALPKGSDNIRSAYIKLTMSKPKKLEL